MSENVVSAGVTIVWRSGGQFGQQNQPLAGSWQSGGLAQQNTQLLAMLQTVGHKGATTPEKVYHSEQAMVLDWSHDPQPLLNACNQAVQAAGLQAGDEVLLVIIEVHSHVRGVCNNCARTLRSMIDGGWGQQFKLACTQANFLCDSLKFLLRTSADETFSTGGAAEGQRKAKEKEKKGQVVSYAWGELPWEHHQLPWNENTGELWKPPEKKGEGEQDDDF
jgi:hypothetical protein